MRISISWSGNPSYKVAVLLSKWLPSVIQAVTPFVSIDVSKKGAAWFKKVINRGVYISDVFMGYRGFPHIAIAAQQFDANGQPWFIRATIDTKKLDDIINAMGLASNDDAFLVNKNGTLQTTSRFYGKVLEQYPLRIPPTTGTVIQERKNAQGLDIIESYTSFLNRDFFLVQIKPTNIALKSWNTLRSKMFFIFISGTILILLAVVGISNFAASPA